MPETGWTRRDILRATATGVAAAAIPWRHATAAGKDMLMRKIPRTGEALPAVGMGTYDTFDVGGAGQRAPLLEVMRLFHAAGGRVIDSSPMYGQAEETVGAVLAEVGKPAGMFLATKVWTDGKEAGALQMKASMRKMGSPDKIDLMQIHNLRDWKAHLATLREWKAAGRVRYIGITHYQLGAFGEMRSIIEKEGIDFVQLPYSLAVREAEKALLPAAEASKVAVLVMRPFEKGGLFAKTKGKPLPPWAAEIDCASWAQLFLKFILAHPAVTAAIPATSKPKHMQDNMAAGAGRLPTEEHRKKMIALLG
jgi:diketogulonate reductase-like aldo/keto reductase